MKPLYKKPWRYYAKYEAEIQNSLPTFVLNFGQFLVLLECFGLRRNYAYCCFVFLTRIPWDFPQQHFFPEMYSPDDLYSKYWRFGKELTYTTLGNCYQRVPNSNIRPSVASKRCSLHLCKFLWLVSFYD